MEIDFPSRAVAHQRGYVRLTDGAFKTELARARTFGFLSDVEHLRSLGLALGGSLENAIVINGDRSMNEDGPRYEDESVRQKQIGRATYRERVSKYVEISEVGV